MTKQSKVSIFSSYWPYVAFISIAFFAIYRFTSNPDRSYMKSQNEIHHVEGLHEDENQLDERFSMGEKELFLEENTQNRLLGMRFFAQEKYNLAAERFEASLKENPNDPEVLIYLNNSRALHNASKLFSPRNLVFGVPVPISNNPNVAKEILRGVAQSQNRVNNARLEEGKGLMILKIANDDNNPEIVTKIANIFAKDSRILGVIGHNSSDATLAGAEIYQKEGIVVISPTSIANIISDIGQYVFRTTPKSKDLAETIAGYTKQIDKSNVAICYDSENVASESFKADFEDSLVKLGGKIISTNFECDFSEDRFNETDFLDAAKYNGAQSILLAPSVDRFEEAMRVAKTNDNDLTLLGHSSLYTYKTLELGQSHVEGMVLPTSWHSGGNSNDEYIKTARKHWKNAGSWRTAMSYDATEALAKATEKVKNRPGIQKALASDDFTVSGAFEDVTFQKSGDRRQSAISLIQIREGNSSGINYEFAPLRKNIKSN